MLACCLALLTGCGRVLSKPDYTQEVLAAAAMPFSFTASVVLEGVEEPLRLRCQKSNTGLVLELLEPAAVAGLCLDFEEDVIHLQYRELMMQLLPGDIPPQSVFVAISQLLPAMDEAQVVQQEALVMLSGTVELTGYRALWDGAQKKLLCIEIPTSGAKIEVEEFTLGS